MVVVAVVVGDVSSGLSSRPDSGLDPPPQAASTTAGTVSNAARPNRFLTVRTVPGLPTGAEDTGSVRLRTARLGATVTRSQHRRA